MEASPATHKQYLWSLPLQESPISAVSVLWPSLPITIGTSGSPFSYHSWAVYSVDGGANTEAGEDKESSARLVEAGCGISCLSHRISCSSWWSTTDRQRHHRAEAVFLISPVATRWSNWITNGSVEPPDLGDGTFHPLQQAALVGCCNGPKQVHGPGQAGVSSNSLLAHVPGETQGEVVFLGATQRGLIAGPRSSNMFSVPDGNPSQAHSSSRSFSGTIPRLHTLLYCGLWCPTSCSFLLAGFWSLLPRTELEQPFKKEKIRGLGTWESRGGGEWSWKVEKTWKASGGNRGREQGDHSSGWSLSLSRANIFLTG